MSTRNGAHDAELLDLESHSLGKSKRERFYRRWCLDHRLFLNPLNDLGSLPAAARDELHLPSIVIEPGEGTYYPGFYNQLKQEFVSARYLYYEGVESRSPHFSDRWVALYDTLDYPAYSLAVERVRASLRMAYSLFDKMGYFLNGYLGLGIEPHRVNFRTMWYQGQDPKGEG